MRSVLTRSTTATRPEAATVVWIVAALALAAAAFFFLRGPLSEPATVAELRVANPHAYAVRVEVRDPASGSRTLLGTVDPGRTGTFRGVIDRGGTWVLGFRASGVDGGDLTVSRDSLEAQAWTVEVPLEVASTLGAGGALPAV